MQSTSGTIGPQLPPGFGLVRPTASNDERSEERLVGPVLPPGLKAYSDVKEMTRDNNVIGPALPSHIKLCTENSESDRKEYIGPTLPPHMKDVYGPPLPPAANSHRQVIGPVLPTRKMGYPDSDDSDSEDIGPKLYEAADDETQRQFTASSDFERRAEKMKTKLLSKDTEVTKREEWMTELPARLCPEIGMGPRSFKKQSHTGKDDDRSEWTDTPADRKRKAEQAKDEQGPSVTDMAIARRNKDISENLEEYNKSKRKQSLLDIHQKKRKLKKNEEKAKERREFNRDTDLNIQKVDAAQTKSFIDKARMFNGKFSHGASHFL